MLEQFGRKICLYEICIAVDKLAEWFGGFSGCVGEHID